YTCTVSTAAKDTSDPGNSLASNYTWSFTTVNQLTVGLTSPNGGQDWTGGSSKNITWNISGGLALYTVKLYYSTNGGASYPDTITANAGSSPYPWILPAINSNQVRVKVEVTDSSTPTQTAQDTSDNNLTIDSTAPQVSSTSPSNGAANVAVEAAITVAFNEGMNQSVTQSAFSISPNPGGLSYSWSGNTLTISHSNFAYNQTYNCSITTAGKDDSDTGNNLAATYSWSFTTVAITITLNLPNGGELWDGENPHNITWTIGGGAAPYTVKLYYSTDGGTNYNPITTNAGSSPYPWTPAGINSTQARVKVEVTDANANTVNDVSNANFAIDSTKPTVTDKIPASGTTGVALDQAVIITFSEEMQTGTAFSLTSSPDPGGWNYLWSSGNTKVICSHNTFTLSTDYTLTVNGKDKAGNSLTAVSWDFKADRAPVLTPIGDKSGTEGVLLTFMVTASDSDTADTFTYAAINLPSGATLNGATGTFTWTPNYTQAGTYSGIVFTVSDGKGGSDSEAITITIVEVNRCPVLASIGNKTVNEGQTLTFNISASDSDTWDTLTYTASGLPSGASFSGDTRTFSWTPNYTQAGTYPVTFQVSDGKCSDSETITITVNNVNQPPVLASIGNKSVNEGETLTFAVTASDSDAGDTISYTAQNLPPGATFTNPTFTWTPGYDQAGTYSVTFIATDNHGASDSETIIITVNNVCQPPALSSIGNQIVSVGELLTFPVVASDSDPGDTLTYTTTDLPDTAAFDTSAVPPVFNWTPTADQLGTYPVTFMVTDSCGLSDSETITITVTGYDADFTASDTAGCVSLQFCFTDLSAGNITSWSWDFGDSGTSTDSSPCHTYTTAGSYTVTLEVSGPDGADIETKVNYIEVYPPGVAADFTAEPVSGCMPLLVDFSDSSTGNVLSWLWEFGDGDTSPLQNPQHLYMGPGDYTVTLVVGGDCGSDSETKTAYIHVIDWIEVAADFEATPGSGCVPLTVDFNDTSTGVITAWSWDFGDGNISSDSAP
ncbi:MAG: PKD domain-containing protein, partial [bacterium]|nr:PKD domain-containing protein [bacterium]